MKDTTQKLSPITVVLHWVIGLAIIWLLAVGVYIHDFAEDGALKWQLLGLHRSVGTIVLPLAAARILWRFYNGMPKFLAPPPTWQKILAHAVHGLLLVATISMPVSGIIMTKAAGYPISVFGLEIIAAGAKNLELAKVAHIIHSIGSKVVIALLIIHLLAAFKHHYMAKNAVVKRMLGYKV